VRYENSQEKTFDSVDQFEQVITKITSKKECETPTKTIQIKTVKPK
jgi:hypothetical protein